MSACGGSAAAQNPVGTGADLCQVTADVERLVVQRLAPYGDPPSSFGFPARVSVTNLAAAREIAADVCALPVVPPGVYHCPKGFGITYNLRFSTVDGDVISVEAGPTGCQTVWGQDFVTRRTALSPGFWQELGTAMGLHRPSQQTFVGKRPEVPGPPPSWRG